MRKVLVLAEGQTEETFIGEVLRPEFRPLGVEVVAVVLKTKRLKAGGHFRGGVSRYAPVRGDVLRLLHDSNAALVTSMLDLYGLPEDFPGVGQRGANPHEWVAHVEQAWAADIASPRFRPYLSLHEFEAFAFVQPARCATVFTAPQAARLEAVRAQFGGDVELINDGESTHPSARVEGIRPGYEKPVFGALLAFETGLGALEEACPHFRAWVVGLRGLASS